MGVDFLPLKIKKLIFFFLLVASTFPLTGEKDEKDTAIAASVMAGLAM